MQPYRILEHTADVGLRIRGRQFSDLLENAACGFFDLITDIHGIRHEEIKKKKTPIHHIFRLKTADSGEMLLKWLRELLFIFSTRKIVFYGYEFLKYSETEIAVRALGTKFDPFRHDQKLEVKAVTYHNFELSKTKAGWMAEVIFDI
jgi:SHS2 domain-containing protein